MQTHILTKKEIEEIVSNTELLKTPGHKREEFAQIKILDSYTPYLISTYGRVLSLEYAGHKGNAKFLKWNKKNIQLL